MPEEVQLALRALRKNDGFSGNWSLSIPVTNPNTTNNGNVVSGNQIFHSNHPDVLFSNLDSNRSLIDKSVSPDMKKKSDNVRRNIDELVLSRALLASSESSYCNERSDDHHGDNSNRGEYIECDDGMNYTVSNEVTPKYCPGIIHENEEIIYDNSGLPSDETIDSNNKGRKYDDTDIVVNLCDDEEEEEEIKSRAVTVKISDFQDKEDYIVSLHASTSPQPRLQNESNGSNESSCDVSASVSPDHLHMGEVQIRTEDQSTAKDVIPSKINEWLLGRRWTFKMLKMLLPALIE